MSTKTQSSASTKLAKLNERFSNFYRDLEAEKTHRRAVEHDRMHGIEERLDVLEREFKSHAERQRGAAREATSKIEERVKDLEARLTQRAAATEERLSQSVSALTKAIESVHEALTAEVANRKDDMEVQGTNLGRRAEDLGSALDEERLARLEREAELIARVGSEMNEVRMRVEAEKNTRESAIGKLAASVEDVRHLSSVGEGDFHAVVLEELSALKTQLKQERAERMEEDELIVQAVGEYSKSIQNGLRIANA
ncbi:SF-assemblin [Ostreococcus tauri]|uniref:Assemblin n=1 Tax=Ostreococcus tauri TaxID=70448 RepID=Q014U3_OSTTA|nr:SF-assemblin [Ostreococcus tauri]OUS47308.1 assemblin [Ostreococcus tauri]CAL54586.1 SF-assemblin [Ostreococcus tauri]|eukprot:XP_003080419.1 SF-assemblin [Ostreococcus tauri]